MHDTIHFLKPIELYSREVNLKAYKLKKKYFRLQITANCDSAGCDLRMYGTKSLKGVREKLT